MLNHLLAGIVALGSLVLFLSGFLFPEVQRKPDLAWSGVALLYALLLFGEGDRTSGGALLGHIASVALILWFGWQTLQQRRQSTTPENQTAIPGSLDALMPFLKEGWGRILTTYGETSVWVQSQLDKGDENPAEVNTPPAPLQDVDDEDWEDSNTAASLAVESPSVETSESPSHEASVDETQTEVISIPQDSTPTPPEVLAQTPSVMENMAEPASSANEEASATPTATDSSHSHPEDQTEASSQAEAEASSQAEPEASSQAEPEAPTPTVTEPSAEPETPTATVTEPAVTSEIPTQPEAASDQEQPYTSIEAEHSTAETMDVSHDNSEPAIVPNTPLENSEPDVMSKDNNETVRVDDDNSWPPEDPVT